MTPPDEFIKRWTLACLCVAAIGLGLGVWQTWCAPGRRCMALGGVYSVWYDTCTIQGQFIMKGFSEEQK